MKYSGAPERVHQVVSIEAQSAAVAGATASICNDERRRLGRTSGCGGMLHKLSDAFAVHQFAHMLRRDGFAALGQQRETPAQWLRAA